MALRVLLLSMTTFEIIFKKEICFPLILCFFYLLVREITFLSFVVFTEVVVSYMFLRQSRGYPPLKLKMKMRLAVTEYIYSVTTSIIFVFLFQRRITP